MQRQAYGYLPGLRASPPFGGTKLYCLVTDAHVCEQLAQGRYLVVEQLGIEPVTCGMQVRRRNHYTTKQKCLGIIAEDESH